MKSKKKFKSELWAVPRWYGKRSLVIEVGPLNGGMSVERARKVFDLIAPILRKHYNLNPWGDGTDGTRDF